MRYLIALLAIAGLIDSALALRIHYSTDAPPCAVTEKWDCGQVNRGRFAVFPPSSIDEDPATQRQLRHHIPVAIFGIIGYALIASLALANRLWLLLQAAEIGFAFAAFLSYIEAYFIEIWCIYCVWSQAIIIAILLLTIAALILRRRSRCRTNPTTSSAVVVAHD